MKTFKRPMFRKGGNVGVGIMSGITDRVQAQDGFLPGSTAAMKGAMGVTEEGINLANPLPQARVYPDLVYENIDIDEMVGTPKTQEEYIAQLQKGVGEFGGADPLTTFLLTGGPEIATATSFADAISKLGPANKALLKRLNEEAKFKRDIRLAGTKLGIGADERAEQKRFDLKKLDLSQEQQVKYLNDERAYNRLKDEDKKEYDQAIADKTRKLKKLDEKQRQNFEQNLINQGQAFELKKIKDREEFDMKKLKDQQEFQKELLKEEREAAESYKERDFMETYENNSVQAGNRAKYENEKIQSKMTEKFGSQNAGLAGGPDGDLEKKKKKDNIGKVYYDVNDGKVKKLKRDTATNTYSFEIIDIDTFEKPKPSDKEADAAKTKLQKEKEAADIKKRYQGLYLPDVVDELQEKSKEIPFGGTGA